MSYDENNIPSRTAILSSGEMLRDRLYIRRRVESQVPSKFKQVVESLSILASGIGIGTYLYSNLGFIPPQYQMLSKAVLFGLGIFGGYRIARGQQTAFKSLRADWSDKETSSNLLLMVWAGIVIFDTYIMGTGAKVALEFTYKENYRVEHLQQFNKELADINRAIDNKTNMLDDANNDLKSYKSIKTIPISQAEFEADLNNQLSALRLKISKKWDAKINVARVNWNRSKAGYVSDYGTEVKEIAHLKRKKATNLRININSLKKQLTKAFTKNKINILNTTDVANNKLTKVNAKIEKLTKELSELKIPVMKIPSLKIEGYWFYIMPFFIALFLSLVELWIERVLNKFNSYEKGKVTKIRNDLIREAGYDPDTYDRRFIIEKENIAREKREAEERAENLELQKVEIESASKAKIEAKRLELEASTKQRDSDNARIKEVQLSNIAKEELKIKAQSETDQKANELEELRFKEKVQEAKLLLEQSNKEKREAEEADQRAKEEADQRAKEEADQRAKEEADQRAKELEEVQEVQAERVEQVKQVEPTTTTKITKKESLLIDIVNNFTKEHGRSPSLSELSKLSGSARTTVSSFYKKHPELRSK